ncbi:hypothetical protein LSUE1_G003163 [Lachnellula suecica]|uniref:Uncharacterized protein n=1 Tax=Lachnellula suecica TaxID=602035 RepID=A0A8T9CA76_9HELO|nr:hypothetical protein LSUE1_G003163 [Lachnellula suecica]
MYESWYLNQYDQYNDIFHEDFEIFGLQSRGSSARLGELEALDTEDVLEWVEDCDEELVVANDSGDIKMLLTRHKRHQHHEIKPWYMAFEKKTFGSICRAWKLPSDYLFMRKGAAGSGTYQKHTTFNEQGSISNLGFTIRVPHSPRNSAKAIWSMAVSWDASNSHTNALFEGVSDADIHDIQQYLQAKHHLTSHPLLLPTMILEHLNTFFIDHRRELERSLFVLEHDLGLTRGRGQTDVWDWEYKEHRESTTECNRIYTGLIYLERRLDFTVGLSQFLLDCLTSLREDLNASPQTPKGLGVSKMMYTVVAQQDSKTNVKIAKAAKRDSSSMTAIAVLGFTFLPAMLVASMFSMSMFDFTASSIVTSNFWVFWAVTIPLTLTVLVAFKLWMSFKRSKSGKDGEALKLGRMTPVGVMREANLALNTPFYPVK